MIGERLVDHPLVRKIVFTGSTATGTRVMARAAIQVKQVTLELGGKSANIVFADCDLERAAATAPYGIFDNAGQDCCARSRILVQRTVLRQVHGAPRAGRRRRGRRRPAGPGDRDGPARVQISLGEGRVVRAGRRTGRLPRDGADGPGFWFPPTVLTPARDDRAAREEIFGPVVSVLPFDNEADAVALANDTAYGLSGSIWTNDLSRAVRVSRAVEAGNLSVNSHSSVRYSTPFGGYKQSGIGRELGPDAPLQFTETKNVFLAIEATETS